MSFNDLSECFHQTSLEDFCVNCGAIYSSPVFALKHPKYIYSPELNPKELFEKMRDSNNNDIHIDQLNKKYIEKRHDIIRVLKLINTRLNFNSQTFFLAICYLDEVVFKCHTITKTSEFLLIGLSCLLIAAKFNENDPNVPEMRKFIVVFCELIKYRYRYRLEDLRIGEIFVLKQLDYKMNYYSIYHYVVFFFAHGIITDRMLSKHFNDLTQSSFSASMNSSMNRKKMIKVLEHIYFQAREIMELILESEEQCVLGRDNYIAAIVILKIAIENLFSYDSIPQEDDLFYLVYGIDENSNEKFGEVRIKVKAAYNQRFYNKNKGKESIEPNALLFKNSVKSYPIKEKKTFDSNSNINNHKTLHLNDYDSQHLLTNNGIGISNCGTTKGREMLLIDNPIRGQQQQYEFNRRESTNIESVREELFAITSKMKKRACSSNKDKNNEPQIVQSNKGIMINKEALPLKYQSSNQVIVDHNIKPYTNTIQQQQQQHQLQSNQNPNDILDKTKFIFNQTRNPKKQIILYSSSVNPNPNTSKPIDNTTGLLYHPGIETLENQTPSTIIINNNININIQDKHLSSSQLLNKKAEEQLLRNDLRRSNHYPSRIINNFGTYYNYNSGSALSSNQLNYYVLNQNKYTPSHLNNNSGNRYGNMSNN